MLTFSNTNLITILDNWYATPYPSSIEISGLTQNINSLKITLHGLSHTHPDDIDILLVGPTGVKTILMSDVGGDYNNPIQNLELTFSATASQFLPDSGLISTGTYSPTNIGTGDTFSTPAPTGPYSTDLTLFKGTNPNGIWSLYVMDDTGNDSGNIAQGWSLEFIANPGSLITGDEQDNDLLGTSGDDTLQGLAGNDTLNGGDDIDTLIGGLGNDVYRVDTTTDTITENLNEGTDTVESSVTYTLGSNLENLVLTGTTNINGTGNDLSNVITGNSGNNILNGGKGNDTLIGGDGNDVYILNPKNKDDLLWRNQTTGQVRYWYMDTTTRLADVSVATVSTPWNLVGTGDFNQDGKDDLLWRHQTTGQVRYWYMDNTTLLADVSVATVSTPWNLIGTGDFNQDGKDDLLWRHQTTGQVRYWYMDNTTRLADVSVATVSTPWNLIGTGDFNQDGKDDLLWHHQTTGEVRYWYMNNTTKLGEVSVANVGTAWEVIGTGDFNQDGKDDLSGRNRTTGEVRYWYMDNTTRLAEVSVATVRTAWDLVSTGDFSNTSTIIENDNGGTDTVESSVNYTLAPNLENLTLTGTTAINGTGNELNNTIIGNTANNVLKGGLGADTLNGGSGDDLLFGGEGNDTLTGGTGLDKFYFSDVTNFSSLGVDTLTNFATSVDKLVLSKTLFTSVGDSLIASELATITASSDTELGVAGNSSAFIVYNSTTGNLFYNPDGSTAGLINGGHFATLSNKPILTLTDFEVI